MFSDILNIQVRDECDIKRPGSEVSVCEEVTSLFGMQAYHSYGVVGVGQMALPVAGCHLVSPRPAQTRTVIIL